MENKPESGREMNVASMAIGALSAALPTLTDSPMLFVADLLGIVVVALVIVGARTYLKKLQFSRMSNPEIAELVNVICDSKEERNAENVE